MSSNPSGSYRASASSLATRSDAYSAAIFHDHAVNAARAVLGGDALAAAWAEGHAMSFEEAIAEALGDDE